MADKYKNVSYVSGSNAVRLNEFETHSKIQKKSHVKTKPKRAVKAKSSPFHTFVLTLVIITTLGISLILLKTQFIVTDNAEHIIALQQQLVNIKDKNTQIESEINKSINMDEVYRIATEELGMIQATEENIKYIEKEDESYTIKYSDVIVDENKTGVNIGNIFGFISKGW